MKIGHPAEKPTPAPTAVGTASTPATPHHAAIPAQADPSAKIALSSSASTLLTSRGAPEFDTEKVARISKSINDGTYKINPETIADKLIANAQELLTKAQS